MLGQILYLLLAFIGAFALAFFQYLMKKERKRSNYLFAFLRFLTVFTLLVLLINPKFEQTEVYTEKPNLIVAVDNSNSIAYLNNTLAVNNTLQVLSNSDLEEQFNVSYYKFDKELRGLDSLDYTINQTNISNAFTGLQELYRNTIAPVILVTDGNQSYGGDYTLNAASFKQAIYPVIIGDTLSKEDIKLSNVYVNKYAYRDNKFPVEITISYSGKEEVRELLTIKKGSQTVFSETVALTPENSIKVVNITLPATAVGKQVYSVNISKLEKEINIDNNSRAFGIEVIDESTNIIIVSAITHPDIGFLKKTIGSNLQRKVSVKKPNEVTNLNDYQLVILYQPQTSFKRIYDELRLLQKNTLTITGSKTNWNFLNGIQNTFRKQITNTTQEFGADFNQGFQLFQIDDLGFSNFPPLEDIFGDIVINKPSHNLINQTINGFETNNPLFSLIDVNGRKEAVLFGENIWRWRAQSYIENNSFQQFDSFMGKVIQFTASNKRRERLVIDYQSFYYGVNDVKISAQYFDKNYQSDPNANITIKLNSSDGSNSFEYPFVLKNNFYEVDLSSLPANQYDFKVSVLGTNIVKSGSFELIPFNIEEQFLGANVTKLQQIATNKENKIYTPETINELMENIKNDNTFLPIQKSKTSIKALIDWKYLLGFLLLLLSIEWFARKYKGLI